MGSALLPIKGVYLVIMGIFGLKIEHKNTCLSVK